MDYFINQCICIYILTICLLFQRMNIVVITHFFYIINFFMFMFGLHSYALFQFSIYF